MIGDTKVLRRLRSASRAARARTSRSALTFAAACSAASLRAASSWAACFCAAAWSSICAATVSPMVTTGMRPVCSAEGSAAMAGPEAAVPMTPVVVSAAMPAARAVVRFIRLGRRCFPVAQVNAMK
ncbi:hypothetical protein SAURM35S_07039 [Streptomyces aurantiogriseus]